MMHGTEDFIDILENNSQKYDDVLEIIRDYIPYEDSKWYELRATLGELRYRLLKANKWNNQKFYNVIDNMSKSDFLNLLENTNGYGQVYSKAFKSIGYTPINKLKYLVKYTPATLPFIKDANNK